MAADVDLLSNRRLILGLGIGIDDSEFDRPRLRMPSVAERAQALVDMVLQADLVSLHVRSEPNSPDHGYSEQRRRSDWRTLTAAI